MSDLDAYIKNMEDLLATHNAIHELESTRGLRGMLNRGEKDGLKMMIEFSIKTAKSFRSQSNPPGPE